MISDSVKIEVKQNLRNSFNANQDKYNQGRISIEAYDILLHLSDKLVFRNSYWQDRIHAKYGFCNLVDRINQIRLFWNMPIMDIDYTYYNQRKVEKCQL